MVLLLLLLLLLLPLVVGCSTICGRRPCWTCSDWRRRYRTRQSSWRLRRTTHRLGTTWVSFTLPLRTTTRPSKLSSVDRTWATPNVPKASKIWSSPLNSLKGPRNFLITYLFVCIFSLYIFYLIDCLVCRRNIMAQDIRKCTTETRALVKAKKFNEAVQILTRVAIELNPRNHIYYWYRSLAYIGGPWALPLLSFPFLFTSLHSSLLLISSLLSSPPHLISSHRSSPLLSSPLLISSLLSSALPLTFVPCHPMGSCVAANDIEKAEADILTTLRIDPTWPKVRRPQATL